MKFSQPWGVFSLFSAARRKVYDTLLKTSKAGNLFTPFWSLHQKLFSVTVTLIKFLLHKTLSDSLSLVLELNLLLRRQQILQNIINVHLSTRSTSLGSEQMFLSLNTSRVFSSVQFSCSVVSSLQPHGLQHARPPCPSPTPGVYSNSCPLSRWRRPSISSSIFLFSCLQSFPASGSFPMSQFFASGGWSIGVSNSASVLPMNIQDWFPLGWTGWISLQSKELSRVFSNTTVQNSWRISSILWHSAFFIVQLSHPYMTTGKTIALTRWTFVGKGMSLLFNMVSMLIITFLPRSKHL